jgi:hypothetical protein
MDLTVGSLNFRIESLGSVRLSDPINSGPSARKAAIAAASETLVGSSSKVNSPGSINPTKDNIIEEVNKIMETINLALE